MLAPYVLTSQTSSMTVLSSSYAVTASYVAPSPAAGLIYYMSGSPTSVSAIAGAEQNLTTITIPANILQVGDRIEFFYSYNKVGTNGTGNYRVRWGGTGVDGTLLNNGANQGATAIGLSSMNPYRVLSTTSIYGGTQFFGGIQTVGVGQTISGLDFTVANTVYFNATRNNAADAITLNDCYIKIIR
jgi:hypothetical protein